MKLRVYLDTSVFSAYQDDRSPERRAETAELWARLGQFEPATSELARQELSQTPDPARRARLMELLKQVTIHPVTEEMKELARRYVAEGVFSPALFNDALHVAAAVLTRHDVLLSWNFRHLVNRRRRAQINQVNISLGIPTIDIVAPAEM